MSDSRRGSGTSRGTQTAVVALAIGGMILLAAGGMLAFDVDSFGDGSDAPSTATPVESNDSGGGPSGDGEGDGSSDANADESDDSASVQTVRPFTIDTKRIEQCGKTCRDVTVSLTNNGNHTREEITVTTKMSTDGNRIWTGKESVGTLGSDESTTQTARVKIGFVDAAKVKQNGGTVTIKTVVRWNGGSETFEEQRQVT